MGLGGYLMWTAVFRELKKRNPDVKLIFAKPPSLRDRLFGRKYGHPVISPIFDNNPYLDNPSDVTRRDSVMVIDPNDPAYTYYSETTPERQIFKTGGHVIQITSRAFGIEDPELKCELYFSDEEREKADSLAARFGPFITIEPNTKDEFTVNKTWCFDNWQKVVNVLKTENLLVQVGQEGGRVLDGVTSMVGKLTFRETAALISKSRLLLAPEGGLMHAANAVGTRAVIVYTGYVSPTVTGYPEHINLYPLVECGNCGLRIPCPIGFICSEMITPEMVISAVKTILEDSSDDRI